MFHQQCLLLLLLLKQVLAQSIEYCTCFFIIQKVAFVQNVLLVVDGNCSLFLLLGGVVVRLVVLLFFQISSRDLTDIWERGAGLGKLLFPHKTLVLYILLHLLNYCSFGLHLAQSLLILRHRKLVNSLHDVLAWVFLSLLIVHVGLRLVEVILSRVLESSSRLLLIHAMLIEMLARKNFVALGAN